MCRWVVFYIWGGGKFAECQCDLVRGLVWLEQDFVPGYVVLSKFLKLVGLCKGAALIRVLGIGFGSSKTGAGVTTYSVFLYLTRLR